MNENNSVAEIAIMLYELLCQKNKKDSIDLLRTLNLINPICTIKVNVF